jgi:hypothetical protein
VVEWDSLENCCVGNCTVGSNPTPSAKLLEHDARAIFFLLEHEKAQPQVSARGWTNSQELSGISFNGFVGNPNRLCWSPDRANGR